MEANLTLRAAAAGDLDAIMAIERRPGFERWVGRSSAAEHRAMMADANYRLSRRRGATARWSPSRSCAISTIRTAISISNASPSLAPDEGSAALFSSGLVDWAFDDAGAHRFWLDCFSHNARAQRVYEKLGFTRDGVLREAYLGADGARRDLTMMALTRPQWVERGARR